MGEIDGKQTVLIGYSDEVKQHNPAGYNFREANLEAFDQGRKLFAAIAHDRWDGNSEIERKIDINRPVRFFEVHRVVDVDSPTDMQRHRNRTRAAILGHEFTTFEDLRQKVFDTSPTAREDAAELESAFQTIHESLRQVPEVSEEEYRKAQSERDLPDADRICNVYLFIERDSRMFKVGFSCDPNSRVLQLQTGNPREIEFVTAMPRMVARTALSVEQDTHKQLREGHVRGEWFNE